MPVTKTPKPRCIRVMMMESKDRGFTASLIFPLFPTPNRKAIFFTDDGGSMQAAWSEKKGLFPRMKRFLNFTRRFGVGKCFQLVQQHILALLQVTVSQMKLLLGRKKKKREKTFSFQLCPVPGKI